jgi:hypothetical protein
MGLTYRRPGIISCIANQSNAGKKENGTEYTINYQGLYLLFRAAGSHENNCEIDQSTYAKNSQNDPKGSLKIHTIVSSYCTN